MIEAILDAMLAQAHYVGDRTDTPAERAALYRAPAEAIDEVARGNVWLAAALIELGHAESRWARYVLEGRCADGPRGARCDWDYRARAPRARGPWQVWSWCRDAWSHEDGSTAALRGGARCAARALSGAKRRCQGTHAAGDWAGMFSGYRANACTWGPAAGRARRMATVQANLVRALAAGTERKESQCSQSLLPCSSLSLAR